MASQAQVVNRGMRVTDEMIARAREGHFYNKVGTRPGQLQLSGAVVRWRKPEFSSYVYVPDFRIAGHPDEVRQVLQSLKKTPSQVEQLLQSGYSLQSLQRPQVEAAYKKELDALEEYKKSQLSKRSDSPTRSGPQLDDLQALMTDLDKVQTVRSVRPARQEPAASDKSAASAGPRRTGRRVPLQSRLDKLKEGQVLDVSNMKPEGTGAKMIAAPGESSSKVGCKSHRVVSSDAATFQRALEMLELSADQVQQCLSEWHAASSSSSSSSTTRARTGPKPKSQTSTTTTTTTTRPRARRAAPSAAAASSSESSASVTAVPVSVPSVPKVPAAQSGPKAPVVKSVATTPKLPQVPSFAKLPASGQTKLPQVPAFHSPERR